MPSALELLSARFATFHDPGPVWLDVFNAELAPKRTEIAGGGGRESWLYPTLHCHRQNDPRIKTGSDESPFNVSLIAL